LETDQSEEVQAFAKSEEMTLLASDFEILTSFQEELASPSKDWLVYKDYPEEKIYYRYEGGNHLCSLYLEKVVRAPIMNLMAVLAEA
jgi:hypothetical protein